MLSRHSSNLNESPTVVQTPATCDSNISSFPKTPLLRVDMDCAPFSKSFPGLLDIPIAENAMPFRESGCAGIARVPRTSDGLRRRESFQIRSITNIKEVDPEWEDDEIEEIMIISPKAKIRSSFLDLGIVETIDISSEFEVLKVIGRESAAARTVLARSCNDLGVYAIKTLDKSRASSKSLSRFKSEQACLRMVTEGSSPFLPKLHRSFHDEARLYLVLDTYAGGSIALFIERDGPFSSDKARLYASELVDALAFLHELNIVHRDVTAQNVMIESDGHVVLTNFSYAKLLESGEGTSSTCGSKNSESPERLLGWMYDFAVDVWSFGVLLCMMHFGQHPFIEGDELDPLAIMQTRILGGQAPNHPSHIVPLSEWDLIKKCLEKNPQLRPHMVQIKTHNYFTGIEWAKVTTKDYCAPYIPYGDEVDLLDADDLLFLQPINQQEQSETCDLELDPAALDGFTFTWDRWASPRTPPLEAFPPTPYSDDFSQIPHDQKKRGIFRNPSVYFARESRNATKTSDFLDLCYSTSQLSLHEPPRPRKLKKRSMSRSNLQSSALASKKSVISMISELSVRKIKEKKSTISNKNKIGSSTAISGGTFHLPSGITQTGRGIGFTPACQTPRSRMSLGSVAPSSCIKGLVALFGFKKKLSCCSDNRNEAMHRFYGSNSSMHEAQASNETFGIPEGLGPRRDSVDEGTRDA